MPDATPHIIVTVNDREHPIRIDEITASQVMLITQHFGITPTMFETMIKAEEAARQAGIGTGTVMGAPQVAALVYTSRLQVEGKKVKAEKVADEIKVGDDVEVRIARSFEAAEVPAFDPPA